MGLAVPPWHSFSARQCSVETTTPHEPSLTPGSPQTAACIEHVYPKYPTPNTICEGSLRCSARHVDLLKPTSPQVKADDQVIPLNMPLFSFVTHESRHEKDVLPGAREKMLTLLKSISTANASSALSAQEQLSRVLGVVLESATAQGDRDLVRALLGAGAEVGTIDMYAAVKGGHRELAVVLAERGASVDVAGTFSRTPLHVAARWRSY